MGEGILVIVNGEYGVQGEDTVIQLIFLNLLF